ncbi:4550_t:CDS:1, partial [Racocetra fulgida]
AETTGVLGVGQVDDDEKGYMSDEDNEGFRTVIGPETKSKKIVGSQDVQKVTPHDIDAFWLQRLVSNYYSDPHTAQDKTAKTLQILESGINTRDCENELMNLFDYDKFDLVKVLTRNRELILWCTKLAKAGNEGIERQNVEREMRERGLEWILKDLGGERIRRGEGAARKGVVEDAMEIDEKPAIAH